jgi:SsrA-binding protein
MPPTIHNHKARRDYFIGDTYEAGIELKGTEVKSLRAARASIDDAFARVERGQCWLYNAHIAPYEFGNRFNVDPLRPRRLLLHKKQIHRLAGQLQSKGATLVPLRIYFNARGRAKVELAVGKGKTQLDKRETLKRKIADREIHRAIANRAQHRSQS